MNEIPPAVRILPMTNNIMDEFKDCANIDDVQQKYFLLELPSRENGSYFYRKRGIKAMPGTVVLFQCQARIIAVAKLTDTQRFEQQTKDGYDGCINFDVMSIMTFKPVEADGLRDVWPSFKGFNQVRQELNPENYSEFKRRLEGVMLPAMSSSTQENAHLPTKEDFESAYRRLTRPGDTISIDSVLDQLGINATEKGLSLNINWRIITEKNIEIWSSKHQ